MNKFEYLQTIAMSFATIIIIFAMIYSNNMNVYGLGFLAFGIYYFSKKYGINSIFMKVSMGLVAFVTIVMLIGYFSSISFIDIKLPNFGMLLLSPPLNLTTPQKQIDAIRIDQPDSQKYTFAFTVYLKNISETVGQPEKTYLFYRKDDAHPVTPVVPTFTYTADPTDKYKEFTNRNGRNIGLRFGNISPDSSATLYLDYAKEIASNTTFHTAPILFDFPRWRWVDVVITVNIDVVNIYIDGKTITRQIRIPNLKAPSLTQPIEFGIMPAYLANLYHSTSVVPPTSSFIEYLANTDGIQT
jgi:hypothetical protein